MEILKNKFGWILLAGLVPVMMGVKSCEKPSSFQHPAVDKGVECKDCHDDGRTKETKPAGHDLAWERNHGSWIQRYGFRADGNCTVCHTDAQCASCHQQEKPRDHTNFWIEKGHGIAVGLDRSRCFACHRGPDMCERCHAQTTPQDHTAAWGLTANQHCLNCHTPLNSAGARKCAICHTSLPSHDAAPTRPTNALHISTANCRGCHTPLRHPDNGAQCTECHGQ